MAREPMPFRDTLRKMLLRGLVSRRVLRTTSVPSLCRSISIQNDSKVYSGDGIEVTFLGVSAGGPTRYSNPSCLAVQLPGHQWLIDVGEGATKQMNATVIRSAAISKIFLTHLHGDHWYGLPGLLCSIDSGVDVSETTGERVIEIYGPPGTFSALNAVLTFSTARIKSLRLKVIELHDSKSKASAADSAWNLVPSHPKLSLTHVMPSSTSSPDTWNIFKDKDFEVKAACVSHTVKTFGYVISETPRELSIIAELAKKAGLPPGPEYQKLKAGKDVTLACGKVIKSADVTKPGRAPKKLVVAGDNYIAKDLLSIGKDASLLVHEATLFNNEDFSDMRRKGHATAAVAGKFAKALNAKALALTHFSQAATTKDRKNMVAQAKSAFSNSNVIAAKEMLRIEL